MLTPPHSVDKLADYEDELRQLKSTKPTTPPPPPSRPTSSAGPPFPLPSRLSNLLTSTRRTASHPDLTTPANPQTTTSDLLHLLTQEQTLRLAAETRAAQTNDEIEELSAQLFSEANEMVASERKARRKLEERVEVLERRDREKRGRLEGLEGRLGRIERVRGLLAKGDGG